MNTLERIWYLFAQSLTVFGEKFMETIPTLLGGILVFIAAWLFAKLIAGGFERLLRIVKFDQLAEKIKITSFLNQAGISMSPSAIIGRFIYWVFVLLIIASAAETLSWRPISEQITKFIDYVPNLITAILVFIVGAYLVTLVRDFVRTSTGSLGISTGRILSSVIYYFLFIMVILTAMDQAKIDTRVLSTNLVIVIGAIMLAAAISYGIASRDVLANILAGFFNKRTFQKGMVIEVDGIRGIITEMTNIAVTIQVSENERVVIPMQELMKNKIKIIKDI
jgi:small-conductance mechanosensitive channel